MGEKKNAGKRLADRLGLKILRTEGHDLVGPCPVCESSDAWRLHIDHGMSQCYSCGRAWNRFDLCKIVLGSSEAAIQAMQDVGEFDPGRAKDNSQPEHLENLIVTIAREKGCTEAGFLRYGCRQTGSEIFFPVYDQDGKCCSRFFLTLKNTKGLLEKGKPAGLFFPGRRPKPGEHWLLVEGVKDAAALSDLNYLACGLNTCRLNPKFAELFRDVSITAVPDADVPGRVGSTESAANLAGISTGVKIATLPCPVTPTGGSDVRDVLRDQGQEPLDNAILGAVTADQFEVEPSARVKFEWLTYQELEDGDFTIHFLIDRFLVANQPAVISGPAKVLKTSLAIDAAISLAAGVPFLGEFDVSARVRVGIMSGESGLATIKETAIRIRKAKGLQPEEISPNLIISSDLPRFDKATHLDAIKAAIDHHHLKVLFLDPLYLALPGVNTASLTEMGDVLRAANEVCRDCTLILLHHSIKRPGLGARKPFSPPEISDVHGAGVLEWCRQFVQIARREAFTPGTGYHSLWLSVGGSAGFSGLWHLNLEEGQFPNRTWDLHIERATDAVQEEKVEQAEQRTAIKQAELDEDRDTVVRLLIPLHPQGETRKFLRDRVKFGYRRLSLALASLIDDTNLIECTIKKHNRNVQGLRLNDTEL
jgi:hypothetical protein